MATRTADTSGLWSATGTWSGGVVPVNGDDVVINAGVAVQIDDGVDHATDAIVLTGITITSSATTPGRLYWKNDAVNGCGNIALSGDIVGTNAANLGQLVATADGTLADVDPLTYTYKAVIQLSSTASIDCTYLDVNMLPDEPTNFSVTPYLSGSKQDFNAATAVSVANGTITITSHGLSNGNEVAFYAAGNTLPTPLLEHVMYYVRSVDTNTFKVAGANSDSTIIDITAVGSGTCSIYKGADTSNPVPVLEDVTGDNWTNGDTVVLCNAGLQDYDQQHNITADTIASSQITLSTAPDGAQKPGAKIYISTMNCSILHSSTSTSQDIIVNGSDGRFGEIRAADGTGTTFRCSGIHYGSGHTATTVSGCSIGIRYGSYCRVSNLSGNSTDIDETGIVYAAGGTIPATPSNGSLNQDGEVSMIFSEHHNGVYGAQAIFQSFGTATKVTAGDGTPIPDQRSGGSTSLIELSSLQSNLPGDGGSGYADNKVIAWEPRKVRVWATSGVSKTYRFYIQSTFAIASTADFFLRATYHNSGTGVGTTTIDSDETISARSGITDWTQYVEVAVNPSRTGWVTFEIELRAYHATGAVYIDPLMVIS